MMKKLVVVLVCVALGASLGAVYFWQSLRNERALTADLKKRVSDLEAAQQRSAWFRPPAPAAATGAATPGAPAAPNTPPPVDRAARQAAATQVREAMRSTVQNILSTPQGKQMARTMLAMQYPGLAKELNLSPEETDKFYDLLVKQGLGQAGGGRNPAGGFGAAQDPAARQEAQRANNAEIADLLGNGKYQQFQDYQKTLPQRQQVTQLQQTLGTGANTLSDSQAKPLIAALAAEQQRIDQQTPRAPITPGGNMQEALQQRQQQTVENNRRLVDTASSYLNPQQLDSYKQMLDNQQNMQQNLGNMFRGGAGQRPGGPAPGAAPRN